MVRTICSRLLIHDVCLRIHTLYYTRSHKKYAVGTVTCVLSVGYVGITRIGTIPQQSIFPLQQYTAVYWCTWHEAIINTRARCMIVVSPLAWSLLELGDKNLDVSIRTQELPFQAHPVHSIRFRLLGGSVQR